MDFVYFNKRPTVQTIAQLEALARTLEVDGFDLCVRPGYLVEPATAGDRLAAVVGQLSDGGTPAIRDGSGLLLPRGSWVGAGRALPRR